jgi:hypothetical protein
MEDTVYSLIMLFGTGLVLYLILSIFGLMVTPVESKFPLSADQQSDLDQSTLSFFSFVMIMLNSPGKEIISIIYVFGGAVSSFRNK